MYGKIYKNVGQGDGGSKKSCIFATDNYKTPIVKMKTMDIFKRYDSPEQYAKAFQQMIDARERWREQIREHSAATAK
jgi:hypothetical protein